MRFPYALFVAAIIAGIVRAQEPSPSDWIRSHYPDLRLTCVQDVLANAASTGFATTPTDKLLLKRAFAQLQSKSRGGLPAWKNPVALRQRGERPVIAFDNVFEKESNDGWQWADDMQGQVATGSCVVANDVDSWKFVAPAAGFYTFEVQGTGLAPIADSWLVLRNHKGDPIANDDNGAGLLSRINVFLPAGDYYLDVAGYNGLGGGDYNLVAQSDAVNVQALVGPGAAGAAQIPVGGVAHDVFQFTVPEGRVNMQVSSLGDTAMLVQRADGGIVFSNDDSSVGLLNAGADIDLPAGSYYAYVWNIDGLAGLPFSLSFAHAPGVLASGSHSGSIAGDESLRLCKVALANGAEIDALTDDGTAPFLGDTVMTLFDRDLDYVVDVDDDDPFNPQRGLYSRLKMNLPAGEYFLAVNGYLGAFGNYAMSLAVGPANLSGVASLGDNALTIPGFGEIATYQLDNLTQASVQVRGSDFWFGILGPDGQLASNTRCAPWQPQVGELPQGASTIFVWDRYDYTGPLTASIVAPLHIEGTEVLTRAKEGDMSWLFANFTGFGAPFNFGVGDRGFFCLQFDATLMTVHSHVAGPAGVVSWGLIPPGLTGVQLQAGDLHLGSFGAPSLATWRNGVEF